MGRPQLTYNHGDSGSKPADGTDFQQGDTADPQVFDWLFDSVPSAIDALTAEFNEIDSDDDGVVDAADQLETGGSDAVIRDTTNAQDILQAQEGGNVEIPNGNFLIGDGNQLLLEGSDVEFHDTAGFQTISYYDDSSGTPQRFSTFFDISNDRYTLRDQANGQNVLNANVGGNVEIPSGNLDLYENDINRVRNLRGESSTGALDLDTNNGGGSGFIRLFDSFNGQAILTANEGGNVEIPNGELDVSGKISTSDSLDVNDTNIVNVNRITPQSGAGAPNAEILFGSGFNQISTGGAKWQIFDTANSQAIIDFYEGGNVEIPNGDLDLGEILIKGAGQIHATTTDVEFTTNGQHFQFYDSTNGQGIMQLNEGGNVDVPSGGMDIAGTTVINADLTVNSQEFNEGISVTSTDVNSFIGFADDTTTNSVRIGANGDTARIISGAGTTVAEFRDNGDVDIQDGELSFGADGNGINFELDHNGIYQPAGTDKIHVVGRNGGSIRHYNGTNEVNNIIWNGGNVTIPNGNLDLNQNNIDGLGVINANGTGVETQWDGAGNNIHWKRSDNSSKIMQVNFSQSPSVDITNGDLGMNGNRIQDLSVVFGDTGYPHRLFTDNNRWRFQVDDGGGNPNTVLDLKSNGVAKILNALEMGTTAQIQMGSDPSSNLVFNDGRGQVKWPDAGGGSQPYLALDLGGNGEIVASNDDANVTQVTNGKGGTVVVGDSEYKIEKNGTDGAGTINFKT